MGNKGSISVDLPALKTQAESAKAAAKSATEAIAHYEKASQSLTSSSLTGQTYDAAKQYCSGPFKTLLTGTKNFYEEASAACEKLVSQYESMVDTKSWDSEELKRLIQSANQAIQNHQSAMSKIQKKKKLTPHLIDAKNKHIASIAGHQALKQKYEKILKGLEQFSQQSASYFSHLTDVSNSLNSGLSSLSSGINVENGTMKLPQSGDWEKEVKTFNTDHENTKSMNEEEKAYYHTLQDVYGFDPQTAKNIIKVKQGIDEKFPALSQQEKDYLFTRLIGGIIYGGNPKDDFMWNHTAGDPRQYFVVETILMDGKDPINLKAVDINECLKQLGLTEKEINSMNQSLSYQHTLARQMSSISDLKKNNKFDDVKQEFEDIHNIKLTDKEFEKLYNQYKKSPDFTHQMITSSTLLYDSKFRLGELKPSKSNYKIHNNATFLNELSGWRGDVTSEITDEPQGGNDDYMSDLDAVNIISRVKKNNDSFMSVSNTYYKDIQDNKINRAKEFKKNQNMKEVEKAINIDKNKNDFSENFLESLKENRNNMYSSKEWKNKKRMEK